VSDKHNTNPPNVEDLHFAPEVTPQMDGTLLPHLPIEEAAPKSAMSRKVGRNVSATIFVNIANMVARMLSVAFVLTHLGSEMYGTWQIIFIPVSLMGTTTMGVSNVYIKFVAEYTARKEYDRANRLLSTGLMFTVPLCVALFGMMYFCWNWLAVQLHLPPNTGSETREAALIVFAIFLSTIGLSAFTDVISGMQEIVAAQWIQLSAYAVEITLIFTLVGMGRGIRGMAEAFLAGRILYIAASIVWSYRNLKWLKISPFLFSITELKGVFGFGLSVQAQCIFDTMLSNIDRIVASVFIGPLAVTPIDLAKKWPSALSNIPGSFFAAFIPAASQLQAEHDKNASSDTKEKHSAIAPLYIEGSRYTNLVGGYFFGLMALLPVAIFAVWLGKPVEYVVPLFVLFNLAMQVHMLTGPGTSILRGAGRVQEEFFYSVPNAVFLCGLIPLSRLVMGEWSVMGIGSAVCLSTLLSATAFLIRVHYVMRVPWGAYLTNVILPGLVPYFVAAIFLWPVTWAVYRVNRIEGAGVLIATGMLYTLILATVLYGVVLRENERGQWRSVLKRSRNLVRRAA